MNFGFLALNLIFWRMGWIFKTESVIMPGFLLTLTPSGAVRGFLPLISSIGRSVPQFFLAHFIGKRPKKKWLFFAVSLCLALPWAGLSLLILLFTTHKGGILAGFLVAYGLGAIALGGVGLLFGTVTGKLVPAQQRGRLIGVSSFIGCILGSAVAFVLMPRWLDRDLDEYGFIFGTTAFFFVLSALAIAGTVERQRDEISDASNISSFVRSSVSLIKTDANFRKFMGATWLLQMNSIIFPHYTAYVKMVADTTPTNYMLFVVVQNLSNAANSLIMGVLADRRGNRFTLKLLMTIIALTPLISIALARGLADLNDNLFLLIYIAIGLAPITNRLQVNYLLELSPQSRHAQYLGSMNLLGMLPLFLSPIFGGLIDIFSFEPVFLFTFAIVLLSVAMISRVDEPRRMRCPSGKV